MSTSGCPHIEGEWTKPRYSSRYRSSQGVRPEIGMGALLVGQLGAFKLRFLCNSPPHSAIANISPETELPLGRKQLRNCNERHSSISPPEPVRRYWSIALEIIVPRGQLKVVPAPRCDVARAFPRPPKKLFDITTKDNFNFTFRPSSFLQCSQETSCELLNQSQDTYQKQDSFTSHPQSWSVLYQKLYPAIWFQQALT